VCLFQFVLAVLCDWRQREHEETIAFLHEGRILIWNRAPNRTQAIEKLLSTATTLGIGNALIDRPPPQLTVGAIRRGQQVDGILSYSRAAWIGSDGVWDSTECAQDLNAYASLGQSGGGFVLASCPVVRSLRAVKYPSHARALAVSSTTILRLT